MAVALSGCGDELAFSRNPIYLEAISGDLQTGIVGTQFAAPLEILVRGEDSLPLSGVRVDFAIAAGAGEVEPASMETDVRGVATVVVVPSAPGNLKINSSVASSSLHVTFLLTAGGPAEEPPCSVEIPRQMAPAEIITDIGGSGLCLTGAAESGATYALVGFNASVTTDAPLLVSGDGITAAPGTLGEAVQNRAPAALRSSDYRHQAAGHRASMPKKLPLRSEGRDRTSLSSAPGDLMSINVNLADECADPTYHTGRVVAVTEHAVLVSDTRNQLPGFQDEALLEIANEFDGLLFPVDVGSFLPPADIDANGRVILFFTASVNARPADPAGRSLVVFRRRDLTTPSDCLGSNAAELLYVGVPDPGGTVGDPVDSLMLRTVLPRQIVHELQHLINASRRQYVNEAGDFEEPWLDEALSQISEELLFQQMASRASRQNLGAYDLSLTIETLAAFDLAQRHNADNYRAFLQQAGTVSPLTADSRGARGAGWSLVRYLLDRRQGQDYESLTRLLNSRISGTENLRKVFGGDLRDQIRDWCVSLLTDDFIATGQRFQQTSWNFPSVFSALELSAEPLALVPVSSTQPVNQMVPPLGCAFIAFSVPPNSAGSVTWTGPQGFADPPSASLMWTLIRLR